MLRRTILFFLPALLLTACCVPPSYQHLTVNYHAQETNQWCWAASGQMSMEFFNHPISQCEQANNAFGYTDCCNTTPVHDYCNQGGMPEFARYGFSFSKTNKAPLSWGEIQNQLYCQQKPFVFTWEWVGTGSHMMTAVGYKVENGQNWVEVNDPDPLEGFHVILYEVYDHEPGDFPAHTHGDDYYNITTIGE